MSNDGSIFKVFLILLNVLSVHVAMTPPNPPPPPQERAKYNARKAGDTIPMVELKGPEIQKAIIYGTSVIEIYTILLPYFPPLRHLDKFFHIGQRAYDPGNVRISPEFMLATSLLVATALLRWACYRELGRAFTYELAIRKEHPLVSTGPYSFVRHPSYTALLTHFPAAILAQIGPGSWYYESGLWSSSVGRGFGAFWIVFSTAFSIFFLQRAVNEDKIMRNEFGEKWDAWARRTPYKFVPYVW